MKLCINGDFIRLLTTAFIARTGDFIVNEIDLEGRVVRLTNFDVPVVETALADEPLANSDEKRAEAEERLRQVIGDEKIFLELIAALDRNDKNENIRVKAPRKCFHSKSLARII